MPGLTVGAPPNGQLVNLAALLEHCLASSGSSVQGILAVVQQIQKRFAGWRLR